MSTEIYEFVELFSTKLKRLRKGRKLSQVELGKIIGISDDYISKIEKGDRNPKEWVVKKIQEWIDGAEKTSTSSPDTDEHPDSEFASIPRYNVEGSCGHGVLVGTEEIVDYLHFRKEWIRNTLRIGERHLCVISVKGDSMEPRLRDGDVVLLDTSSQQVEDNAIYAIQVNGTLSIKRVQRYISGSMRIISDNSAHYGSEELTPEQAEHVKVVGRVVWAGGKI